MSLAYPPQNEEEIFRHCTKECGIITATEDQQYFALGCIFCAEKFLYFDAFITHMQTGACTGGGFTGDGDGGGGGDMYGGEQARAHNGMLGGPVEDGVDDDEDEENLTDADACLLEPQMIMIKEEPLADEALMTGLSNAHELQEVNDALFRVKEELPEVEVSMEMDEQSYMGDGMTYVGYDDYNNTVEEERNIVVEERKYKPEPEDEETEANYDDLVEESLLGGQGFSLTMHIKDRKMIQFLIDSYRRNHFLWDHRHPQFRDRSKRQQFLEWIIMEFKRRFNLALAKDAVTRKWDNLRTVYKRECNRMSLEKTNVSTLWYFKELHFLNSLYGGNQKISEAVVKECVYRRRYSALWNDVSTSHLLSMVQQYPCFYDKYNIDYRSKEKRGEGLQIMAAELSKMIDVTTIQISKRISQLRFDYAKQKAERLQCESRNKVFVPTYSYYDQMFFMDSDISPFKCDYCAVVLQTNREMDVHILSHQTTGGGYPCPLCQMTFLDGGALNRHKQEMHFAQPPPAPTSTLKEIKYHCDLCTASFREESNYQEHMRRHNDELLIPSIAANSGGNNGSDPNSIVASLEKPYACEMCSKSFASVGYLNSHRALHTGERSFKCDFPQCGKTFAARQSMMEHSKQHYSDDDHRCEICGKGFKSVKNLQNHRQIHDAVKRYVCKTCGSAFAQAAGLYLHKRRHNRQDTIHPLHETF